MQTEQACIKDCAMHLSILVCCMLLLAGINGTAGYHNCYDTRYFTANSTYGANLDLILSSLPGNASENGGFYTTTFDQGVDKIYALALCEGDDNISDACSACVSSRIGELKERCPNQTAAFNWNGCLVRYADQSFFGTMETQPIKLLYNTGKVENVTSNVTKFYQTWDILMDALVERASSGTSSRLKYFATGIAEVEFQKIRAIMQCTPDISQRDCKSCLRVVVGASISCCQQYRGGPAETPSCSFRWDLYDFFNTSADTLYLNPDDLSPPPPPPDSTTNMNITTKDNERHESQAVVIIVVVPIIISLAILVLACILLRRRKKIKEEKKIKENKDSSKLLFDFNKIKLAADNFSENNKLGQGGFGSVYKGRLSDGQDIAVKRLSGDSSQGDVEFKNEVLLTAKLQHRNLVRLLGFSMEGKERLLVYEFLPNSSLDHFIFNPKRRSQLDWDKRRKIITGISQGILYLHEYSQYRIVHRDLKAANILLDGNMNPKIADFGMARLFSVDQTHGATSKLVGTFGYMAPEYIRQGAYSAKSDVYSFGVLVLEIIVGEKISSFLSEEGQDLLTHAWKSWERGEIMNMIDPTLSNESSVEIMRSIHIGLLCVQATANSRPAMTSIVSMLTSHSVSLPLPSRPAFVDSTMEAEPYQLTDNELSLSEFYPR